MRFPRWLLVCLAAALGCGDSTDRGGDPIVPDDGGTGVPDAGSPAPIPDGGTPPMLCSGTSLELGTGLREYQPVSEGDTVFLYRGPQDGYMIYLSVRARGLDPSDVTVCYTEKFVDTGKQFGYGCWRVVLTNDLGDGRFERIGLWGQVDSRYFTIPGAIRGKDADISVTATDGHGCSVTAGWKVHVSDQPGM